jgi:hypothetical protein
MGGSDPFTSTQTVGATNTLTVNNAGDPLKSDTEHNDDDAMCFEISYKRWMGGNMSRP